MLLPFVQVRSAWFASSIAAFWSYTSCIQDEGQSFSWSWPSCGTLALFVLRNPFAWSHNVSFPGRNWRPFQPYTEWPCARRASCTYRHSKSCALLEHWPWLQTISSEIVTENSVRAISTSVSTSTRHALVSCSCYGILHLQSSNLQMIDKLVLLSIGKACIVALLQNNKIDSFRVPDGR